MALQQYLHNAPKTELHVHLEGSIQPATLLENELHIAIKDIDVMLLNGFRSSFLSEQRRQEMEQNALTELTMLKKKYLTNSNE